MNRYSENYPPGCYGSVNVVHVTWSSCPAGDNNHCKGKEGFLSVAFEVISGNDRQILAISFVHYGTQNDKNIMKLDENAAKLKSGCYNQVEWRYFKNDVTEKLTSTSI